jgi:hypothetical protein
MKNSISVMWHIDDIKTIRPDLNNSESMQVLEFVRDNHDASIGINWDVLEDIAEILYPINKNRGDVC